MGRKRPGDRDRGHTNKRSTKQQQKSLRVLPKMEINESTILEAIEKQEFRMVYQPQVNIKTRTIESVESLLRWEKGGNKTIPPLMYLPFIEKRPPLFKLLGDEIFNMSLRDYASIGQNNNIGLSVNISGVQLKDKEMPRNIRKLADYHEVSMDRLTLEITETVDARYKGKAKRVVDALNNSGVALSIDDYGVGYSTLDRLLDFPVQEIKIDKTYTDKLLTYDGVESFRYIKMLASALGVKTVVEGVETKEQSDFLLQLGFPLHQGYYYSRPLELNNLLRHLK